MGIDGCVCLHITPLSQFFLILCYKRRMGKLTSTAYSRLDALIDDIGDAGLLDLVAGRIAIGESQGEIATSCGLTPTVLRRWLEEKPVRVEELELARRCFAESLAYEGLRAVRDADADSVAGATLQFDAYSKTAGKVDRVNWGEKQQVEVMNVHSVDFRGLLEMREAKLKELVVMPMQEDIYE